MKIEVYAKVKWFLILVLIVSLLLQLNFQNQLNNLDVITARVVTSGTVGITICQPIRINFSDCNSSVFQNQNYGCQLSLWNSSDDANYSEEFILINRIFNSSSNESLFNISRNGSIFLSIDNNDVGNYTINFEASKYGVCGSRGAENNFNLSVINVNDAPIFSGELDDLTLTQSQTFYGFYLGNYFSDPDLDTLLYNVSGNNQISIECGAFKSNPSPEPNNHQVIFSSDVCDITETVIFTAIDPDNATKNSNHMNITVNCDSDDPSGGSSGGGGGGSSGSDTGVDDTFRPLDPKFSHFSHDDCTENWNCTKWSECLPDNVMIRTCLDLKECGTIDYKPIIVKNCTYTGTCNDGIKNCHHDGCEENIDCGGPCLPCKLVDISLANLKDMNRENLIYILSGLTLALILLGIYFHETVMGWAYSALSLLLIKKKEKQILISVKDKNRLLKQLKLIETKIGGKNIITLIDNYGKILKEYLTIACGNNLTKEFSSEELKVTLNKKDENIIHHLHDQILSKLIRKEIKVIFIEVYSQYEYLESNQYINKEDFKLLIESLRNLIIQTSEIRGRDLEKEDIELKAEQNTSNIDIIKIDIINIYIALEFLEMGVVERRYSQMIKSYQQLTSVQKIKLNSYLDILNLNMKYVKSWYSL